MQILFRWAESEGERGGNFALTLKPENKKNILTGAQRSSGRTLTPIVCVFDRNIFRPLLADFAVSVHAADITCPSKTVSSLPLVFLALKLV